MNDIRGRKEKQQMKNRETEKTDQLAKNIKAGFVFFGNYLTNRRDGRNEKSNSLAG